MQLPLPLGPGIEPEDDGFILSEANAEAVRMLENWQNWPVMAALLTGPAKSGRSKLAHIFAAQSGGNLIDDAEATEETDIFHAWNIAQSEKRPLLIVASAPPPEWEIRLPDLRSRLAATPKLKIAPPDDVLFDVLLRRRFEQRELIAPDELLNWLAHRADRSYAAIDRIVELLDAEARIRRQFRLTIPFVRSILMPAGLLPHGDNTNESND